MNKLLLIAGFTGLYVALDAASFIHPLHGLNITPWNPAPALGLVFLLRQGTAGRLPLVVTVVFSELVVRGVPASWWTSLLSALILACGYVLMGEFLRRRIPVGSMLDDRADLLAWIAPTALGTLANSIAYITSLRLLGLLPADGWQTGILQFWVGDAVGIAVVMPLLWWLSTPRGRALLRSTALRWETLGYSLLGLAALAVSFGFGGDNGFKLFYLLFLPIVWASARQGMAGAIISATLLQAGVISAVQVLGYSAVTIAELQLLSLAMALVGFFIGSVVAEQQRTSEELRQTLRLAAAGEMAGALAHELNQPLTALAAYASACETLLANGEGGARLDAAIKGMLGESARTGEIVRRLRDFFRTGATKLEPVALTDIVEAAALHHRARAAREGIRFELGPVPGVALLADALQLQVVIRNLLSNAFDAVADAPSAPAQVSLHAELLAGGRVCITVADSGPGMSGRNAARLFEPFHSSKSSGLGLGLAISRAIAQTHGGNLWGEVAGHGLFKLVLQVHEAGTP